VHALSHTQRTQAYEQGGGFARNRAELMEIATASAQTLGTNPSFDQWTEYATQWKDGYVHNNPDNTANSAETAWARFTKTLDEFFGLTKPKSTSKVAEKKATEREAKKTALLEKHADTSAHTLQEQVAKNYEKIAKAVAQGKPAKEQRTDETTGLSLAVDLKKEVKELEAVIKAKTSEENKAHGEELKAKRTEAREAVAKCTDIEKLEAVIEILDEYTDISYTID
jgi:phenylpropionate dioxygenase-like ring-hydroxylating dioxygenase large terminal subunit